MKQALLWGDAVFFVVFAAFLLSRAPWNPRTYLGAALAVAGFALWTTVPSNSAAPSDYAPRLTSW